MHVFSSAFQMKTGGFSDIIDITSRVENSVVLSKLSHGIATVFVPGSTASVTTIEYEEGALDDLRRAIERLAPRGIDYAHNARWGDGNGFSHVRASLLGPSLSVPFSDGCLKLGTWQQIVMIDFDNRPRTREVYVQIVGE